jgi:hypothetical protein
VESSVVVAVLSVLSIPIVGGNNIVVVRYYNHARRKPYTLYAAISCYVHVVFFIFIFRY